MVVLQPTPTLSFTVSILGATTGVLLASRYLVTHSHPSALQHLLLR